MVPDSAVFRADLTCNGVTQDIPVEWKFLDDDHLKVLLTTVATGVSVPLTLGSDYTVTGAGSDDGGNVHTAVAYSSAYRISVVPDLPFDQSVLYTEGEKFPAKSHEGALDKLTLLVRQVKETLNRCVRGDENASTSYALPPPEIGKALGWATDTTLGNVASSQVEFAADLANTTSPGKGAGMVGFNYALNYGAGTVGKELANLRERILTESTTATTGGTTPNFTAAISPAITSYIDGLEVELEFHTDGVLGSSTLNINGLGAVQLRQLSVDGSMVPAEITPGLISRVRYNGTYFIVLNPALSFVGSLRNQFGPYSGDFTLTQAMAGHLLVLTGTGVNVTLPAPNSIRSGSCFILRNEGSGRATILWNGNASADAMSSRIEMGETVILQSDGTNYYRLIARTCRGLPDYSNVAASGNNALGTVYQVDADSTVVVMLKGSRLNGIRMIVGPTSSPGILVAQFGDDINDNTKAASFAIPLPKGWYYMFDNSLFTSSWETITVSVYRNH